MLDGKYWYGGQWVEELPPLAHRERSRQEAYAEMVSTPDVRLPTIEEAARLLEEERKEPALRPYVSHEISWRRRWPGSTFRGLSNEGLFGTLAFTEEEKTFIRENVFNLPYLKYSYLRDWDFTKKGLEERIKLAMSRGDRGRAQQLERLKHSWAADLEGFGNTSADILVPENMSLIKETINQFKKSTLPKAMSVLKTSWDQLKEGMAGDQGARIEAAHNALRAASLAATSWRKNPKLAARIVVTARKFVGFAIAQAYAQSAKTTEIQPADAMDGLGPRQFQEGQGIVQGFHG